MMFPFYQIPLVPWIPTNCSKPPTLYALMNSIVNYGSENPTGIKNLAEYARTKIFDFDYPLTDKISKEDFEIMILNHFIMRRIGYQTFTAWQIALNVKLNEIMPYFNTVLNAINGWDLFNDGESITRNETDNRNINTTYTSDSSSNTRNNITNMEDLRYSNMPQDNLDDIQNGKYMTDYTYNNRNTNNTSNTDNLIDDNTNVKDDNTISETINRSPGDKISILKQFMSETRSVYSMIFKELDTLFYGLE